MICRLGKSYRLTMLVSIELVCHLGRQLGIEISLRSGGSTNISGAGSTFIYPAMMYWVSGFQITHQGTRINYQSIGSGGGIQQMRQRLVDFGAY